MNTWLAGRTQIKRHSGWLDLVLRFSLNIKAIEVECCNYFSQYFEKTVGPTLENSTAVENARVNLTNALLQEL